MPLKSVIASRELELLDERGARAGTVTVSIGLPYLDGEGIWRCDYEIAGLEFTQPFSVSAGDSLGAIQGALTVIAGTLAGSDAGAAGRLRLDGRDDLGFPMFRSSLDTAS